MPTNRRGGLIVISAPSGAGKTTLVRKALNSRDDLAFSISYTTRPSRPREKDGVDYCFVTESEFQDMISRDEFLECAQVFGHWYGTSRDSVEALRAAGKTVLLEIDWQGADQIRTRESTAISLFILPPSRPELERRLRGRGTDSKENIGRRLREALTDMAQWEKFDYVLINEDVDTAVAEFKSILDGQGDAHQVNSPAVRRKAEQILANSS
ncbi:MAG: guanylate kinase [Rhodospirillaceae bacterium]|nr:guanylate kinase [Rhodospirillaceae bacterium]